MPTPRRTRAQSETRRHTKRRERRAIAALAPKGGVKVVEPVGSGYLPPHQAKLARFRADVRYSVALDCGMPRISGKENSSPSSLRRQSPCDAFG